MLAVFTFHSAILNFLTTMKSQDNFFCGKKIPYERKSLQPMSILSTRKYQKTDYTQAYSLDSQLDILILFVKWIICTKIFKSKLQFALWPRLLFPDAYNMRNRKYNALRTSTKNFICREQSAQKWQLFEWMDLTKIFGAIFFLKQIRKTRGFLFI